MEQLLSSSKRQVTIITIVVFVVMAVLTISAGAWYYRSFETTLTNQVNNHIQTLEALSAKALALRLDRFVTIAQNYASQPDLQNAVASGAWNRGVLTIENLLTNDSSFYDAAVDRVFLLDLQGKINVAFPGIAGTDIGTIDPGYATWKTPLLVNQKPYYVSSVVLRSISPRINVIKILVPISKGSSTVGVLRFDVPINAFSDLGKNAELTSNGFVYFTDATGQIVSHPKVSSEWPIVSFASVPSVNRAIHGQNGIDVVYNPIEDQERLSAYGEVPGYGWAVIAQEPSDQAFATRNSILRRILLMVIAALLIEVGLAIAIILREIYTPRRSKI